MTSMALPSPRVMPSRLAAKGWHWVGETTRIESQARRKPKVSGASWPPVMAAETMPERTMWKASADGVGSGGAGGGDVQDGAGYAEVDGDVAGSGGGHGAGDRERVDAGVAGVELDGLGLFGLATGAGAADDDGDVCLCRGDRGSRFAARPGGQRRWRSGRCGRWRR